MYQTFYFTNKNTKVKNVQVTFRDLAPETNPDFEMSNSNQVILGLVKPLLNSTDRTPVYCCGDNRAPSATEYVINNQSTFYSWFHPEPNVNVEVQGVLRFTQNITGDDRTMYSYSNDAFFPLDNRGFQNPNYQGPVKSKAYPDSKGVQRNFHFCMDMHASFTYFGGETFFFKGDDDAWLFIDNKLVLDLGGQHDSHGEKGQGLVKLDDIKLKVGKMYPFDFFYCERHSSESNILINTSINLECRFMDFCGVCEGTGKCLSK
ncbi:hypothetical protein CYY_003935 [Polysphondylium violaceum]|uniref:PA14 domain-containing protein n=1 Tax=Polysphondylium violaceum TaxID=133409 RepID=A0A8J4V5M1_9MYCE|nr:hypothetical protein CYY_003935 [Polysphondylium violaceum]